MNHLYFSIPGYSDAQADRFFEDDVEIAEFDEKANFVQHTIESFSSSSVVISSEIDSLFVRFID